MLMTDGRARSSTGTRAAQIGMRTSAPLRRNAGFTLLEILIALLVLSIGLLGLAALQAATVQFNHSAFLRSQATNLAYDIVDRMRANRAAALNGDYDGVFASPAPACNAPAAAPATIAAADVGAWRNALACRLPSGTGLIDVDANGVARVGVRWDETRGEGSTVTVLETFEMSTGL